ncbi:MAG: SIS domain-containing protein [Mycoplasmatales bacterium]
MSKTENEILNQFDTWNSIYSHLEQYQQLINKKLLNMEDDTVVVFTGAGTSGFIGDILEVHLNKKLSTFKYKSIFSTHIVSDSTYINKNSNVLLISFGRSGNSPESVGAVNKVKERAGKFDQIIITCNKDGSLATTYPNDSIILPPETNDEGFAMTNSFSTMLITAFYIFGVKIDLESVVNNAKHTMNLFNDIPQSGFESIYFISNNEVEPILKEYALKINELTAGKYNIYSDQILNFRHGPKSSISKKTLIFLISSNNEYNKKYELDIYNELLNDENEPIVYLIGNKLDNKCDIEINCANELEKILILLPLIQRYAVKMSTNLSINPDNPNPGGSVNRVVQGVEIY